MAQLPLATMNPAKVGMLRRLADGLGFDLLAGPDADAQPGDDEPDATHEGIAVHKAVAWSRLHPLVVLASDGGIVIPARGNAWESRLTRRQTGEGEVPDETRARRLLGMMKAIEGERRAAHRVEAVAVARDGALLGAWEAQGFHCRVGLDSQAPPAGTNGAWLESVLVAEDGRRWGQLGDEEMHNAGEPWQQLALPVRDLLARLSVQGEKRG